MALCFGLSVLSVLYTENCLEFPEFYVVMAHMCAGSLLALWSTRGVGFGTWANGGHEHPCSTSVCLPKNFVCVLTSVCHFYSS
jgi:hypothetical protein